MSGKVVGRSGHDRTVGHIIAHYGRIVPRQERGGQLADERARHGHQS